MEGTGWKNRLVPFEKTRKRKGIGTLQKEITNHHLIKLKPHLSAYTANKLKVTGETLESRRKFLTENRLGTIV